MSKANEFIDQLRLPLIGSPMFIVSTPALVIAQCRAGVVGSFPALNARPQPALRDWLTEIRDALAADRQAGGQPAPYAVNQICHASNDRLMADMELCVEFEVPLVITSLQLNRQVVDAVHSYGGLVFHDVINVRHADKAIDAGVDGVIAVCTGAGGHAGRLSPFALCKEIRARFDGMVILAGAITSGADVAAARAMGADLAYMGTRFIATEEANAVDGYKQMIVDSAAKDVVYTSLFSGVHGNYLKGSVRNIGMDPDALPEADKTKMNFGSGGNTDAKAWVDIWSAGQGVGGIDSVPNVADLVDELEAEFNDARNRLAG
ncbi:MAG: nitronate monooxygenase family protein [Pseudomonadota bacterium]